MTQAQFPAMAEPRFPAAGTIDAGFWRRAIASVIDCLIVSACVSTVFLLLAATLPGLGKVITLQSPLGLFTTDRTLESRIPNSQTTEKIVERTVAGQWTYLYRVTETEKAGHTEIKWQQLDPVTREDIKTTGLGPIVMIVLFVYWILMEASGYQASFGKLALGMKVVDEHGRRLTIPRAAGRNLLKFLSAAILLIGFLMTGWTRRKQALHDIITRCYVVVDRGASRLLGT